MRVTILTCRHNQCENDGMAIATMNAGQEFCLLPFCDITMRTTPIMIGTKHRPRGTQCPVALSDGDEPNVPLQFGSGIDGVGNCDNEH